MMPAGPVLRDIHMPPPASWWPPAPGWWILAALLLVVLALLARYWWRRRMPRRRWRMARRELAGLYARSREDPAAFAAGVSQLLRRVARLHDPASAHLPGRRWHAALRHMAGKHVSTQALERLDLAMYAPCTPLDTAAVERSARAWLRRVLLHGGRRA